MLVSKTFPELGPVHHPIGAATQLSELVSEVRDYFESGITLRPGDTVFDVGANIGAFALEAARRAGGGLRFHCFEPIPELYSALQRNFERNALLADSEPTLHPIGLTGPDGPDEAEFHYFKRLPCDTTQHLDEKREEFASFFSAQGRKLRQGLERFGPLGGALGRTLERPIASLPSAGASRWVFERSIGATRLQCRLSTLSRVAVEHGVQRIDLLKVDVEGAELDVLRGVGPEDWPRIRQVALEGHDDGGRLQAIEALLRDAGFSAIQVERPDTAQERGLNNFMLRAVRNGAEV
jgi:FkbM family methyltransferase